MVDMTGRRLYGKRREYWRQSAGREHSVLIADLLLDLINNEMRYVPSESGIRCAEKGEKTRPEPITFRSNFLKRRRTAAKDDIDDQRAQRFGHLPGKCATFTLAKCQASA